MINLRVPLNIYLPMFLRYKTYSSNGKDSKNTIELVNNQEEILTEKFRMLRPYIQERDVKLEAKILSILETQQGPWTSEITNVSGTRLDEEKLKEKERSVKDSTSSSTNNNNNSGQDILNYNHNLENLNVESEHFSKLSTPSLDMNNEMDPMNQTDLSTIGLPLNLQHKDENILVAAVVHDLDQMYTKTADMAGRYYLLVHQYGLLWCARLKMTFQDPIQIKNIVLNTNLIFPSMKNKLDIWLTEDKPASTPATPAASENKPGDPEESPIDKIKKTIQNVISTVKQKVEEKKKSMAEKK